VKRLLLAGLFLVALLVAALVLAPLGAALAWVGADRWGLSADSAEGTVWSGRLRAARIGGLPLGEVELGLAPLSLLSGALRLDASARDGAFTGRAAVVADRNGVGVEDAHGEAPLNLFRAPLPLSGLLRFEGVTVRFREGRCVFASGRVQTSGLRGPSGLLGETAPALSGEAACRDGALFLPLEGAGPAGEFALHLSLEGDGRYRAEARMVAADPALEAGLRLAGFTSDGRAQVRAEAGRLWR